MGSSTGDRGRGVRVVANAAPMSCRNPDNGARGLLDLEDLGFRVMAIRYDRDIAELQMTSGRPDEGSV